MRKKIFLTVGVLVALAVVLSLTAFAAEEGGLTDYGIITVMFKSLELGVKSFLGAIDAIYLFFKNLFG